METELCKNCWLWDLKELLFEFNIQFPLKIYRKLIFIKSLACLVGINRKLMILFGIEIFEIVVRGLPLNFDKNVDKIEYHNYILTGDQS